MAPSFAPLVAPLSTTPPVRRPSGRAVLPAALQRLDVFRQSANCEFRRCSIRSALNTGHRIRYQTQRERVLGVVDAQGRAAISTRMCLSLQLNTKRRTASRAFECNNIRIIQTRTSPASRSFPCRYILRGCDPRHPDSPQIPKPPRKPPARKMPSRRELSPGRYENYPLATLDGSCSRRWGQPPVTATSGTYSPPLYATS